MTALVRITLAIVLTLFLSSCGFNMNLGNFGSGEKGNGIVVEDNREVTEDFTRVSAAQGLEVYITQANDFNILVEADENIIDLISTDIEDGELDIHTIKNIGKATTKIYVSLPKIDALYASSGALIQTETKITSDKLDIQTSSGAYITANLEIDFLDLSASSGSRLDLSGKADKTKVAASSGANIDAKDVVTKACEADASSGSNISLQVTDNLIADAGSGANISYKGDPSVQKNNSVSGSIHQSK